MGKNKLPHVVGLENKHQSQDRVTCRHEDGKVFLCRQAQHSHRRRFVPSVCHFTTLYLSLKAKQGISSNPQG